MDLDGMTIRSEEFWMWIIEKTTASLLDNPKFQLEEADLPDYTKKPSLRFSMVSRLSRWENLKISVKHLKKFIK